LHTNKTESLSDTVQEQQKKFSADLIGRIVVTHYWDDTEPRLLGRCVGIVGVADHIHTFNQLVFSATCIILYLLVVCEATLGPDNILLARSRRRHTNTGGLLDKKGITSTPISELRMVSII